MERYVTSRCSTEETANLCPLLIEQPMPVVYYICRRGPDLECLFPRRDFCHGMHSNIPQRVAAILHSLHRAIISSPTPLPETLFTLNINDDPRPNAWSFSRTDNPRLPQNPWLMPHFSSWSWPLPFIGPLDEALTKIEEIEQAISWTEKIDKAVWRGTAWFNPDWSPGLRPKLVSITEGKKWADVAIWSGEGDANTINITDFCKYKYIIYTEVGIMFHQFSSFE